MFYFYQILSFNRLKTISEGVLLLPNTVPVKRAEDYIRGCSTSTKYCPPLTSWRLYHKVVYFYQILSPLNKVKTISECVLLLPNTVTLKQVEDYIRGCSTSTKYCPPLTSWRLSEGGLLLPNTVTLKQVEDYIRGCSTSTKYCPLTSWRLYQRVFYFYQILSSFNKLKTISEGVLLLPKTVTLKQVEDYIRECSTSTKYCLR